MVWQQLQPDSDYRRYEPGNIHIPQKTGITEFIALDAEVENTEAKLDYLSKYPQKDRSRAEKEYDEYSKYMHAEGRISIPIKENAGMDEELPPCKYTQK